MAEMKEMPNLKEVPGVEDFVADFAALREDVAKLSASELELIQAQAASTKEQVLGSVDDARQRILDEAAQAKSHIRSVSAELENSIERNPLLALFAGAVAGFVIGLMSRPRK